MSRRSVDDVNSARRHANVNTRLASPNQLRRSANDSRMDEAMRPKASRTSTTFENEWAH